MKVTRQAVYIPIGSASLFCWVHSAENLEKHNRVALICPPLGYEYMSSHRTLRHLADALAEKGVISIRLDYVNTGNSSDLDTNASFVENAVSNIVDLSQKLTELYQVKQICCLGLGLGASFAMKAAARAPIGQLVLWAPCINGSRFIREIKALSGMLKTADHDTSIEAAGLLLSERFEQELKTLNLTDLSLKNTQRVLYLHPAESKPNKNLIEHLKASVSEAQVNGYSGHEQIITYPTDTVVPVSAIQAQVNFITESMPEQRNIRATQKETFKYTLDVSDSYQEKPVYFAGQRRLFGVLGENKANHQHQDVLVIFLNCGSEHHVGPHRIYTNFSRQLAKSGISSFRFDIEGIGDSISRGNNQENYAYSPVAMQDITDALEYAKQQGYQKFIFTGICAGAYHSFKVAAELDNVEILGAIIINPLVFDWVEKNASKQSQNIQHVSEVKRYKKLLFSAIAWKKLFSGKVRSRRIIKIVISFISFRVKKFYKRISNRELNLVEKNLNQYLKLARRLNIILADSDPGYHILMSDAKPTALKAIKLKHLAVDYIDGADHGLSKLWMRNKAYSYFLRALQIQLGVD